VNRRRNDRRQDGNQHNPGADFQRKYSEYHQLKTAGPKDKCERQLGLTG
jgi:hypothetical protein